ncbi:MAG: hypothetical protein IJA11_08700 [Oscillospiraceae bacterium]|nr:hypothetical protein [Oscillospiraceae bacterium]
MSLFNGKKIVAPVWTGRVTGVPGIQPSQDDMTPEMAAMLLTRRESEQVIGVKEIRRAAEILKTYKDGRANLEDRIVEDELWWELRHWEAIRNGKKRAGAPHGADGTPINTSGNAPSTQPEPSSAWLFNAITNKHADAMDNFPEPVVLPREKDDEASAKVLSSVLPVLLEYNNYEQTYSDNWWEKLKHGTAAYGVFWNKNKENGLGDVDVKEIDLLKLFWAPGITNIQDSRNLFIVELVDEDLLDQEYPELQGKPKGNAVDVKQYLYDDTVDTSEKAVVVDWYYKVKAPNGQTILHYVKFVGDNLLYASENDPDFRERGYYDHGMYPVVLDVLFPEKGTPVGFGYVAICKDPQLYIDKLSANILENAMMVTKKRFFVSSSTNVNVEQFKDWNNPIVTVEGELDDRRIKEIVCQPLDSIYVNIAQMKIEEMKDTAANRDVNSGGAGSGVTAAAAIAALQEAGNKASRDMIAASYRAHVAINTMCIELIRQFYDEVRSFRITGASGAGYQFVDLNNAKLKDQIVGKDSKGNWLYRRPVFDLKIKAQKKNPFSRMEQNERAKELFNMGFFNPQRAQETLGALDMMDFEGIDKVREYVQQGQTLLNICMQLKQENEMLRAVVASITGKDLGIPGGPQNAQGGSGAAGGKVPAGDKGATKNDLASGVMQAKRPMTGYEQALVKRSRPDMSQN